MPQLLPKDSEEGGGTRRSGWAKPKNKRLHDQGYSSLSSGEEEGDSESEESDVDGSDEEYTGPEKVRGLESSEEDEEVEEEESEGSVSGVETVRVEKVTVDHEVYTSSGSCFCSACRVCDYDKCLVFAMYPALVPKLQLSVVEETVIMDTGVDPVGVDGRVDGRKKKGNQVSQEEQRLFDAEGYRYTVWGFLLRQYVKIGVREQGVA